MLAETLRSLGYSVYDRLLGGHVLRHLAHIQKLQANPELLEQATGEQLQRLLSHAARNIPYYQQLGISGESLADFPVIRKPAIKERRDEFIWASLPDKQRHQVSTSGTYGSSMRFIHSPDKLARRRAEVLFYNQLAGYRLGMRFASLRAQAKSHLSSGKTNFAMLAQNEVEIGLTSHDPDEIAAVIQRLNAGDIHFIVGWPAVLKLVAAQALNQGLALQGIKGIVTMGEALQPADRAIIEQSFNCPIFNRYACKETGLLAHELPGQDGLVVNRASYLMEVLHFDRDEPVAPGEAGRIVVTDLYSFAMPLIRYDTGDIGVVHASSRSGVTALASVDGRYVEGFFDTAGRSVLAMCVIGCLPLAERRKMWQFQFVQDGPGSYALNVVQGKTPIVEEPVVAALKSVLGEDAQVRLEYVTSIPLLPSGKYPLMVNRMKR